MKVRVSGEAKRDLRGIGAYIARDNPNRAASFVADLQDAIRKIGERPLSFPSREDLFPGLRSALYRPYLILFRVRDETVEVGRIIHGAKDLVQTISPSMFE